MRIGPSFFSLRHQLSLNAQYRGGDIAYVQGAETRTWKQTDTNAVDVSRLLAYLGVSKNDRVALLTENSIWSYEQIFGIWGSGAVAAPMSPLLTPQIIQSMLENCGAKVLLCSRAFEAMGRAAVDGTTCQLVVEGSPTNPSMTCKPDNTVISAQDPASIVYSSGTTGLPKGIVHSHGARWEFARIMASEFSVTENSSILSSIPPHSNGSWILWLGALIAGARSVVLSKFDAQHFFETVAQHRITHGFIVPTIAQAVLDHPLAESGGLRGFEMILTAGAPMPKDVKAQLIEKSGDALFELWGLTEGVATVIKPAAMKERLEAVGRPVAGCELKIINEEDEDVTGVHVGEIVARSTMLMDGYWEREELNASIHWATEDGRVFIRTGDLGAIDGSGYLTLKGRSKDMIISGGYNVYPVDIEQALLANPAVRDASVLGIEDEKWGEAPIAFVILEEDALIEADTLLVQVNQVLAKPQRLKSLILCKSDFPRNTLGKVVKSELKLSLEKRGND